jgi:hypothetical protein
MNGRKIVRNWKLKLDLDYKRAVLFCGSPLQSKLSISDALS